MKSTLIVIIALFVIAAFALQDGVLACLNNGDTCQPDGSLGNCCSNFCYKQEGWALGDCR